MSTFVNDVRKLIEKQRCDIQKSPFIVREEYQDRIKSFDVLDATPVAPIVTSKFLVTPEQQHYLAVCLKPKRRF